MLAHRYYQHRVGLLVLLAAGLFPSLFPVFAAEARTIAVDPEIMGLDLPAGTVKPGTRTDIVATHDDARQPVVGRVHAFVGKSAVILLPDGELVARKPADFSPTDR